VLRWIAEHARAIEDGSVPVSASDPVIAAAARWRVEVAR
jgi:hypothetical protein